MAQRYLQFGDLVLLWVWGDYVCGDSPRTNGDRPLVIAGFDEGVNVSLSTISA